MTGTGNTGSTDFTEIHDELRAVARDVLGKADPGAWIEWRRLAELGWLGLEVPDALGGAGATFAENAIVLRELGRAAAAGSYLGGAVLAVGALARLEATPGRDALLRGIAAGESVAALALPGDGNDTAGAPRFRLEHTPCGLRVSGWAAFVPDAAAADRLLLVALDAKDVPVVVDIDPRAAGVECTEQPVLDATRRLALVTADDVAVGQEVVYRFAGDPASALRRLGERAAVAVACDSLGLAEAMLDKTVAYVGVRTQFGREVGSFQAVKHACADMFVRVSVTRQLVRSAVREVAVTESDASVAVSMAKSYAGAAAVEVVGKATQLHGGIGYTWESGIHHYLKRATLNRALFGSPSEHRSGLARRYGPHKATG